MSKFKKSLKKVMKGAFAGSKLGGGDSDSFSSEDLSKVVGGGKEPTDVVGSLKEKYKLGGYDHLMDDPEARKIKKQIETGKYWD